MYDRATMMHYRQSPLSKTPPANLPAIPGVTCPETEEDKARREAIDPIPEEEEDQLNAEEEEANKSAAAAGDGVDDDDDGMFGME